MRVYRWRGYVANTAAAHRRTAAGLSRAAYYKVTPLPQEKNT